MSTAPLARRVQAMAGAARPSRRAICRGAPRDFGTDELGSVAHTLDDVARELSRRVGDLSQDRARIDAIVAGMVEGVLVVDSDGHIQRINAAARHLLGVGEMVMGQPFAVALRDAAIADLLSRALRGQADAVRRDAAPARSLADHRGPGRRRCPATAAAARWWCCTTSATSAASIGCGRTSSPTCRTSCARR